MQALRQWTAPTAAHAALTPIKLSKKKPKNKIDYLLDDNGRVLASSDTAAPEPWEVVPSENYPGHFFFFNTTTSEVAWSLHLDLFETLDQSDQRLCSHSNEQECPMDSSVQKRPLRTKENVRTKNITLQMSVEEARLNDVTKQSTPYEFNLNKKNAILHQLGTSLDSLALTAGMSSRASSESLASDFSAAPKQPAYPMAYADGTPSVEVLAGLGAGGYACVCLVKPAGRRSRDEELMAMKVVSKVRNKRPKDKKRLQTELKLMRDVAPSRFLQRCHSAFESATDVFFVCDYLAGGDLFFHMVKRIQSGKGPFPEDQARNILAEVALGLVHLHDRGFIHRDLKVENLMLDASGHVKIIDFGLALEITSRTGQVMSPTGSLSYMPPELVKSGEKTGGRHTDWWALGVLAYELMTGRAPWSSLCDKVVIRHEIQNCKVHPPTTLSPTARHFIESLLEIDFRRRLGFGDDDEVKRARFFGGVDWLAMERGDTPAPIKLDSIGPDVVNNADSKNAIDAYANKMGEPASSFFSEVGKFGVKSPYFVGLDVVTSHPKIETQSFSRRR